MHHSSSHPTSVAKLVVRIGFGIALALVGVAHYLDAATFAEAVGRGLGALEPIGMVWGYLLPGLMIVGGVLMALGFLPAVGAFIAGVALVSIPAGLMLKSVLSGLSLNDTMPPAMNAIVWILFYVAAVRGFGHCNCETHAHGSVPAVAPRPVAPVKAPVVAPKPMIIAKAPAKKPMPPTKKK
jgi:uncharacterized membrane protein YphA (DoxX/SURF4 family)